jgi:hypothetical protein
MQRELSFVGFSASLAPSLSAVIVKHPCLLFFGAYALLLQHSSAD